LFAGILDWTCKYIRPSDPLLLNPAYSTSQKKFCCPRFTLLHINEMAQERFHSSYLQATFCMYAIYTAHKLVNVWKQHTNFIVVLWQLLWSCSLQLSPECSEVFKELQVKLNLTLDEICVIFARRYTLS